jgi:hypothetical protein
MSERSIFSPDDTGEEVFPHTSELSNLHGDPRVVSGPFRVDVDVAVNNVSPQLDRPCTGPFSVRSPVLRLSPGESQESESGKVTWTFVGMTQPTQSSEPSQPTQAFDPSKLNLLRAREGFVAPAQRPVDRLDRLDIFDEGGLRGRHDDIQKRFRDLKRPSSEDERQMIMNEKFNFEEECLAEPRVDVRVALFGHSYALPATLLNSSTASVVEVVNDSPQPSLDLAITDVNGNLSGGQVTEEEKMEDVKSLSALVEDVEITEEKHEDTLEGEAVCSPVEQKHEHLGEKTESLENPVDPEVLNEPSANLCRSSSFVEVTDQPEASPVAEYSSFDREVSVAMEVEVEVAEPDETQKSRCSEPASPSPEDVTNQDGLIPGQRSASLELIGEEDGVVSENDVKDEVSMEGDTETDAPCVRFNGTTRLYSI